MMRVQMVPRPPRRQLNRRLLLLFPFLFVGSIFALPSLLLGLLISWQQRRVRDPQEFWRGLIAIAIAGGAIYGFLLWLADPLAWIWAQVLYDVLHLLWLSALSMVALVWSLNLFLAPGCAILFTLIQPGQPGQVKPGETTWEHQLQQGGTHPNMALLPPFAQMVASPPLQAVDHTSNVLGTYLGGDLDDVWLEGEDVVFGPGFFDLHGLILGEPGMGKTWTLLRLAIQARRAGRKIVYLDMKGSNRTATLFFAAMRSLQVPRIRLYPQEAYDGWRGTSKALYNRLMEQIDPGTHAFYRGGVGSTLISLAVNAPGGQPKNSYELLERINHGWLKAAYATDGQAMREIEAVIPHISGLQLVMSGFFRGIGGGLDGAWAFEDVDACYLGIDSVSLKEEAALFGRYLLEDVADYAVSRKQQDEQVLLIIDEFGGLKSTNATDLYEKIREVGMCIYSASQSYHSLGRERDHVLAASHIKILHRSGSPKEVVVYGGQRDKITYSRVIGGGKSKEELLHPLANRPGEGTQDRTFLRSEKEFAVPIEEVQQLGIGQVALISGGQAGFLEVSPLTLDQQEIDAARKYLSSLSPFVPLSPPPYIAPPPATKKKTAASVPPVGSVSPSHVAPTVPATKVRKKTSKASPPPPVAPVDFFN